VLLIRHGQSEFNVVYSVTRVDPGIRDPRLTETGRAQARAAAGRLAGEGVRRLLASPYTRALETAEIIADALGVPITVTPLVGERAAFACDVGTETTALRQRWPGLALDHLAETWWPTLEETEATLHGRCIAFRREIAAAEDWRHVAVVTHWGFIRGLTGQTVTNGTVLRIDPTQPDRPAETLQVTAL
jgi:broad specificity phosphatase PhoE